MTPVGTSGVATPQAYQDYGWKFDPSGVFSDQRGDQFRWSGSEMALTGAGPQGTGPFSLPPGVSPSSVAGENLTQIDQVRNLSKGLGLPLDGLNLAGPQDMASQIQKLYGAEQRRGWNVPSTGGPLAAGAPAEVVRAQQISDLLQGLQNPTTRTLNPSAGTGPLANANPSAPVATPAPFQIPAPPPAAAAQGAGAAVTPQNATPQNFTQLGWSFDQGSGVFTDPASGQMYRWSGTGMVPAGMSVTGASGAAGGGGDGGGSGP